MFCEAEELQHEKSRKIAFLKKKLRSAFNTVN